MSGFMYQKIKQGDKIITMISNITKYLSIYFFTFPAGIKAGLKSGGRDGVRNSAQSVQNNGPKRTLFNISLLTHGQLKPLPVRLSAVLQQRYKSEGYSFVTKRPRVQIPQLAPPESRHHKGFQ
jgi:hypothetical protein